MYGKNTLLNSLPLHHLWFRLLTASKKKRTYHYFSIVFRLRFLQLSLQTSTFFCNKPPGCTFIQLRTSRVLLHSIFKQAIQTGLWPNSFCWNLASTASSFKLLIPRRFPTYAFIDICKLSSSSRCKENSRKS